MPRVVRIYVTDGDATESSSDDNRGSNSQKLKRDVNEIRIEDCCRKNTENRYGLMKNKQISLRSVARKPLMRQSLRNEKKFRAAEIRDPSRRRVLLGTNDTAVEADLVYDRAATQLNFIKPPKSAPPLEVILALPCCYNSGKESLHNLKLNSPTSVLSFNSNDKIETELQKESIKKPEWRAVPPVMKDTSLPDDCLPLEDPCFLNEFFDYRSPSPVFCDEINAPVTFSDEDFDDVSVDLDEDFKSCTWDMDALFEDDILLEV